MTKVHGSSGRSNSRSSKRKLRPRCDYKHCSSRIASAIMMPILLDCVVRAQQSLHVPLFAVATAAALVIAVVSFGAAAEVTVVVVVVATAVVVIVVVTVAAAIVAF